MSNTERESLMDERFQSLCKTEGRNLLLMNEEKLPAWWIPKNSHICKNKCDGRCGVRCEGENREVKWKPGDEAVALYPQCTNESADRHLTKTGPCLGISVAQLVKNPLAMQETPGHLNRTFQHISPTSSEPLCGLVKFHSETGADNRECSATWGTLTTWRKKPWQKATEIFRKQKTIKK